MKLSVVAIYFTPCPKICLIMASGLWNTQVTHKIWSTSASLARANQLNSRTMVNKRILGAGKLFALHSGDGRILWQLPLRGVGGNARLFLWRSSRDAQQAPEVLVLSSEDCTASYTVVNTHTGSVVEGGSIPGTLQQVHWLLFALSFLS